MTNTHFRDGHAFETKLTISRAFSKISFLTIRDSVARSPTEKRSEVAAPQEPGGRVLVKQDSEAVMDHSFYCQSAESGEAEAFVLLGFAPRRLGLSAAIGKRRFFIRRITSECGIASSRFTV